VIFRRRHLDPFFFNADNCFEDSFEIVSSVGGESAWDVLPDTVSRIFSYISAAYAWALHFDGWDNYYM
jgi:hypothetical protein